MIRSHLLTTLATCVGALVLTACGGGGGDGTLVYPNSQSRTTFNLGTSAGGADAGSGGAGAGGGGSGASATVSLYAPDPPSAMPAGVAPLVLLNETKLSDRLRELTFQTPAFAEITKVRVLLPKNYDANPQTRYPSLHLLHGCCNGVVAGGGYNNWTDALKAEAVTLEYPLIVVMPEGGRGGFYTDWYNNGMGGVPMWETYHIHQLLPWIDNHYRTINKRSQRAVAGLSMGGFGAYTYASRHPELFIAAGSFSGVLDNMDNNSSAPFAVEGLAAQDGGVPGSLWGMKANDEVRYRAHNPVDLADNLRGMSLTIRTGNGQPGGPLDPVGSSLPVDALELYCSITAETLHKKLVAIGVDHLYDAYGPGTHSGAYWTRDLVQTLPILMDTFAKATPYPTSFAFTTADPAYGQYDWKVAIQRTALEFSTLVAKGAAGFTLTGSGTATVKTPAVYTPGKTHAVTVSNATTSKTTPTVVDADGRLSVTVPMGPANAYQAFTAQAKALGSAAVTTTVAIQPAAN